MIKDENGFISTEEFKEVFSSKKLDDDSWKLLIQEVDSNGDGQVYKLIFIFPNFKFIYKDFFERIHRNDE